MPNSPQTTEIPRHLLARSDDEERRLLEEYGYCYRIRWEPLKQKGGDGERNT